MGVDAADFDRDGDEDLFMTHLVTETNTLYVNDGTGMFEDATSRVGLGPPSLRYTSWGTHWLDYDNDGWLDIFVANGAVRVIEELARQGDPFPFHETNQLFRNLGNGRFEDVTAAAGPAMALSEVNPDSFAQSIVTRLNGSTLLRVMSRKSNVNVPMTAGGRLNALYSGECAVNSCSETDKYGGSGAYGSA